MRVLILRTWTDDCDKITLSLEAVGHEVHSALYDDRPHDRHGELVDLARLLCPDAIVYIGAIERYHMRPCLEPATLKRLRDVAPTIHICSDGSEPVWWELLVLYEDCGCFDAQVNIDGVRNTPIEGFKGGAVLLTPTDPRMYRPKPWEARTCVLGMAGALGHGERAKLIQGAPGVVGLVWRDKLGSYAEMAAFLCDCRMIANCPANGTGDRDHVKGRVLEAGWAGALLVERANAPITDWFADDEYLAYADYADFIRKVEWAKGNETECRARAEKLAATVQANHHPAKFWGTVFSLAGIS